VNYTTEVGKAVFSPGDLQHFADDSAASYSLADDITLPNTTWNGPSDYTGRFYGNGYTIRNLTFTSPISGSKGLFNSFGANAQVHDLNLEVTPSATPLTMNGALYLGALIGYSSQPGLVVENVHVTGEFNLGPTTGNYATYVAGIIGNAASGANLTMKNCSVDMDITVAHGSTSSETTGLGGLVGNIEASVDMQDCYTTGSITGSGNITGGHVFYAGGLIARNLIVGGSIKAERCYSSMTIEIIRPDNAANMRAAGLFGYVSTSTATIANVVALNKSITFSNATQVGRILGSSSPAPSGAYARSDMVFTINGDSNPTLTTGNAAKDGESKTPAELSDKAFWMSLDFTEANWDVSPLSSGGWPTLR
jgi:hypothetical protein